MKAIVQNDYGTPDVLKLAEVAQPAMKENQVLVRVKAASINAGDVFTMRGNPWLTRLMVGFPSRKTTSSAGIWLGWSRRWAQRDAIPPRRRGVCLLQRRAGRICERG
jgi:hypothetical protein